MEAMVFGASGGIGKALITALTGRADISCIHAVSRQDISQSRTMTNPKIRSYVADILDEASLQTLITSLNYRNPPALVLVATGILSEKANLQPEKSYRHQSLKNFEHVFRVNTFAPALIAKHVLPLMPRDQCTVFAALSARVGSISDNRLGGWHAYRASKTALNMLIKNYAIEQTRKNDQSIVVSLHPGTVDTSLSRPFQKGLPDGQVITPDTSAQALLGVIDRLTPHDSGTCFDWRGNEIPA